MVELSPGPAPTVLDVRGLMLSFDAAEPRVNPGRRSLLTHGGTSRPLPPCDGVRRRAVGSSPSRRRFPHRMSGPDRPSPCDRLRPKLANGCADYPVACFRYRTAADEETGS